MKLWAREGAKSGVAEEIWSVKERKWGCGGVCQSNSRLQAVAIQTFVRVGHYIANVFSVALELVKFNGSPLKPRNHRMADRVRRYHLLSSSINNEWQGRSTARGARGAGNSFRGRHGGPQGPQPTMDKPKREAILDLSKYVNERIRVKFTGGREGVIPSFAFSKITVLTALLSDWNSKRIRPIIESRTWRSSRRNSRYIYMPYCPPSQYLFLFFQNPSHIFVPWVLLSFEDLQ